MTKARARELRKEPTDAGRLLWSHLRRRQLAGYRFRRQHPIGPYVVDLFCFERSLAIEVDGGHHGERIVQDADRTGWLEAQGYRVLRFWNSQVLGEIEAVKQVILEALES